MPYNNFPKSPLELYNPVSSDLYITDISKWYRLPVNEDDSVLVVSTTGVAATYWVIAYTIIITLIFMAACELALLAVLTFFRTGTSGTRHAMLVAYYNAGNPSHTLPLMLGYLYNGLFCCQKAGKWTVDWIAVKGSCLLFIIAFSLLAGDLITKFFLGGGALIKGHTAQVNPAAVFYPDHNSTVNGVDNILPGTVFDLLKGPRAPAVYQAVTRKTSARKNIYAESRLVYDDQMTHLENGTVQYQFRYQYNISGYELGLRDAPGLTYAVRGSCSTYHGRNLGPDNSTLDTRGVAQGPRVKLTVNGQNETSDLYSWWANMTDRRGRTIVPIERENYTAPWALFSTMFDNTTLRLNKEYGGYIFMVIPRTAWRGSLTEKLNDPWYETEPNPAFDATTDRPDNNPNMYNPYITPYRVKRARPPVYCTQNDTYTYNKKTVNHIDKLDQLPGLKISPLVRKVLGREFGVPVFSPILNYLPFGSLASSLQFVSNQRRLDAQRADITIDFRELVETAYVYSREVIRNTVLLFPSLDGNDPTGMLRNAAASGSEYSTVDRNDADFLIESQNVAALSVVTMIAAPVVCVFLWLAVFSWVQIINTQARIDNSSPAGRHRLRRAGLQATHLYRFIDEEVSKERKWSGRNTNTPFIRDLDRDPPHEQLEVPVVQPQATSPESEIKHAETQASPVTESFLPVRTSTVGEPFRGYVKPKLVPAAAPGSNMPEEERTVWEWTKQNIFRVGRHDRGRYDVVMTRMWDPELPPVRPNEIREHC